MSTANASTSHADSMDRMYRVQRHIYDLTRKYYLLGRDRTIREMGIKPGARVLELGCGTGRNLKLIAQTYPGIALCGLDISQEMLISAKSTLSKANVEATLLAGDATSFKPADFLHAGFDHILLSYALSMIPQWEQTIRNAATALAPGGTLHIVDFGQQERLPRWFSNMLFAWLKSFHVTPRADLPQVIEETAKQQKAEWSFTPLFNGYAWTAEIRKP